MWLSRFPLMLLLITPGVNGVLRGVEPLDAFLEKHCIRCHGPAKTEGDVCIDKLSRDFKSGEDAHHWAEVLDRPPTIEGFHC